MTNESETGGAVWVRDFSIEAAARMGGDYLAQSVSARTVFAEIELALKAGTLQVFARGVGGMVERPLRDRETFPAGDYRVKRATVEAWLRSTLSPAPVSIQLPDAERRLALLRALGGGAKYARGEWKFAGMTALVAAEKSAGRGRCDAKTIRLDLKEAAQTERDAKAAGFADGLG